MATLAWRSSESAFRWSRNRGSSKDEQNMMEFLGIAGIPGGINILGPKGGDLAPFSLGSGGPDVNLREAKVKAKEWRRGSSALCTEPKVPREVRLGRLVKLADGARTRNRFINVEELYH